MSMSKFRTIKGRKFLKQVDDTLKCGNRMPILFPGEPEPVDIIQWQVHPSDNIRKDPVSFYFSIRPTQLHLNHVRRIQVD